MLAGAASRSDKALTVRSDVLKELANHSDPSVLVQLALALGELPNDVCPEILASLATARDLDPWVAQAVVSSAKQHAKAIIPHLLAAIEADKIDSDERLRLLSDLFQTVQSNGASLTELFGNSIRDLRTDDATRMRIASCLVQRLRSPKPSASGMGKAMTELYASATAMVVDADLDENQRCDALSLFGLGMGDASLEIKTLVSLVSPNCPASLQTRSIDCLVPGVNVEKCDALFDRWPQMSEPIRQHFVSRMLQNQKWTLRLFEALESDAIRVGELSLSARQHLAQSGSRSMRVRAERLMRGGGKIEKKKLVESYLSSVSGTRDLGNGESLFKKHCAVCHVAKEGTPAVGASLKNLTDRTDLALLTAILDPNRAADPQYVSYLIHTDADRVLTGTIESETGASLTLAHADGKRTTVQRDSILQMKNSGLSLMPEGFETTIPPQQMKDLLAYLQELR